MSTNQDHVLALPKFVFALKIVQLVVAVTILGLTGYGITFAAYWDGISLSLFTAIATIIIAVYFIVATTAAPVIYNYWALLGLDIFAIIFWLSSFALLASQVAAYVFVAEYYTGYGSSDCTYIYGFCVKKRDVGIEKRATTDIVTWWRAMAATAGLGGLEFILFIITLVFTGIYLHRHRKAGNHCMPGSASQAPTVCYSVTCAFGSRVE